MLRVPIVRAVLAAVVFYLCDTICIIQEGKMDRRNFLLAGGLILASAYSFGERLKPLIEKQKGKTALIYGTRYGATADTAKWIARGMDNRVDLLDIETIDPEKSVQQYERFIIGSGIWIDGPHQQLIELLTRYQAQMEPKIIASFIVCGTTGEDEAGRMRIEGYFERFHAPLDVKPKISRHFGGRMIIEKLSEKDRKLLDNFYNNVLKKEFTNWDRTQPEAAEKLGRELPPSV